MTHHPARRRLVTALALALALPVPGALGVAATTPELPPNASGHVAICVDGERTIIVPESELDAAMEGASSGAPCATAPGPDAYGPPPDPAKGYHAAEIDDGIHWVTDGIYQAMFVVSTDGVIVVDAPPSMGPAVVNAVAEVTDQPISHVIYSHSHADHIAGAGQYPADATYVAHAATAAELEAALAANPMWGVFVGGGPVPLPTVTFDDAYTLTVGDQTLELSTPTIPAHEPGNIFIHAPAQKVLVIIDVVFPGWSPFKDLAQAEDAVGYLAVHDEILAFGAETIVTGHVGRLGTNADVELNKEYMAAIGAAALGALQSVDAMAIGGVTGFANPWLWFDTYFDELVAACEATVVPAWTGRLAGADVFTADHCYRIIQSMRLD